MRVFHAIGRIVFGRRETVASTVYGTIVVMATVAAGSRGAETDTSELASFAAVGALVIWVAHVYSHALAESLQRGRRLTAAEVGTVARHQLAIALAAVAPVASLVLASLGLFEPLTGVRLALGFGIATLAVQGARYAALERLGPVASVLSIVVNVSLGFVIVALEAAIKH